MTRKQAKEKIEEINKLSKEEKKFAKSLFYWYATLAQLVEHLTCNEDVVGSIPTGGSILNFFSSELYSSNNLSSDSIFSMLLGLC